MKWAAYGFIAFVLLLIVASAVWFHTHVPAGLLR